METVLDCSTPLRSEYVMRVFALTTCNENVHGAEKGDHKGRPNRKIRDGLFSYTMTVKGLLSHQ